MRRELGLAEKFVIGHVGRFHYAKNHEYLLEVFAQIVGRRARHMPVYGPKRMMFFEKGP